MKNLLLTATLLCLLITLAIPAIGQVKTVKIKQEKALPYAHEFIVTWEGGEYKTTYYEVKGILEGASMVQKHYYLHEQQRIVAIVKNPWTYDQLRALFESRGFQVMNKAN